MVYPCIVYEPDISDTMFADNRPYRYTPRYKLTVIERDADGVLSPAVAMLPMCVHNRPYKGNGLYHNVFLLYF